MLAAVSNFYFFYMIAILTVVYVLVRMFDYLPKKNFKSIVLQLMPFAGYAIVGVLMGCVLFYPSVMTMLSSNRTSADSAVPLFYSLKNYINFPFAFSTSSALSGETLIGHLPLASLAILLLWRRRGERTVKILLAVCLLFLLFPVFGWLLNGMAYVTSRWTWAFSLLIGMICALYLPDLAKLSSSALLGQLSVISVFCVLGLLVQRNSDEQFTGMLNLLLVFVLPALVYVIFANRRHFQVILKSAVLLTTVICVAGMGYSRFLANDFVLSFVDSGTCLDNIRSAQGNALNTLEDQSFYRFEDYTEDARSVPRNATLLNGGNSTNCFFSLSSPTWYELLHSLGYRHPLEQDVQGTDNRTVVGMLANVKYFTGEQSKQNRFLPYGYSEEPIMSHWLRNSELNKPKPKEDTAESLLYGYYQNDLALRFGYTYDSYISRREYDALSYNEKQTALLHAAVLEEDSTLLPKAELPEGTDHKVDFTVEYSKDLSKQGNQYIATKNNQWMTIKLNNALPDRETYLTMYQASFMQEDPYVQAENNGKLAQMKPEEVDKLKQTSYNFKQRDNVLLTARMNDATKNIRFYSSASAYYTDARDVCTNLGYLEQTPTEIRVRFNTAGIYTIEALEVTQLDLSACEQRAREMSAEHLKNVVFSDNLITGDITVSDNKLLCLSLPYSIGWTAYVDGKKTDIRQTDLAFMGIELAAGTHQIELRYHTPYLKGGIILSIAGFAIFLILWLYHNRKFRIWFADKLDRLCSAERYAKH